MYNLQYECCKSLCTYPTRICSSLVSVYVGQAPWLLCVGSPLVISFGCSQVAWDYSFGSACACALNIQCMVLSRCEVLYCLVCRWLFPLGSSLSSNVMFSLFVCLITPYSLMHQVVGHFVLKDVHCLALVCGIIRRSCLTVYTVRQLRSFCCYVCTAALVSCPRSLLQKTCHLVISFFLLVLYQVH
jgi:hypothetical protein